MPSDDAFEQRLHARIHAPHWWLAFSGGLDSMVLLHRLVTFCREHTSPRLTALHVHHGLQADADQWAAFCQQVCANLGVECRVLSVTVQAGSGQSIEMAAREARYAALEACLNHGEVLWMAHHQDDQAETMLMRLLRGAGPAGLAGMPVERPLGEARVVRPLLDTPRQVLEVYARAHALEWVDDPSNDSLQMDRNFLRHEILPRLAERWPAYRQGMTRSAHWLREQASVEHEALHALLTPRMGQDRYGCFLVLDGLERWSGALRQALLRQWLQVLHWPMPSAARLASLDQDVLLSRPDARGTWAMNDGVLSRFQQRLYRHPAILPSAEGVWAEPAHAFVMNADMRLHASAGTGAGCLCADFPLQVRYRQGGERCRPAGRGHSQTLKHLMQEYAVPPWLRDAVPLLYAGDTLVAVGDYWVCAEYEAAENQTGWKIHWEIAVAN